MKNRDRKHVAPNLRDEKGSVLVIVAAMMVSLLGFAGLAIDFGYLFVQKSRLQSLVDSAALACGYEKDGCLATSGNNDPNIKLFTPINPESIPLQVSVTDKPVTPTADCPDSSFTCYKVTGSKTWNTFFLRMFGLSELSVSASASAIGGSRDQNVVVPTLQALNGSINLVKGTDATVVVQGKTVASGNNNFPDGESGSSAFDVCEVLQESRPSNQFTACNGVNTRNVYDTSDNCSIELNPGTYCESVLEEGKGKKGDIKGSIKIVVTNGCEVVFKPGNYYMDGDIIIETSSNSGNKNSGTGFAVDGTQGVFIYQKKGTIDLLNSKGSARFSPYTSSEAGNTNFSGVVYWNDTEETLEFGGHNQGLDVFMNGIVYAPQADVSIDNQQNANGKDNFGMASIIANSIDINMNSGKATFGPPPEDSVCTRNTDVDDETEKNRTSVRARLVN